MVRNPESQCSSDVDYAFDNSPPSVVPPGGWKFEERRLELQRDAARATASSWRWRILGAIVLTVIWGWAFRWDLAPIENHNQVGSAVLMVNRWTGELRWIQGASSIGVEEIADKK